jgi:hypothetical protein
MATRLGGFYYPMNQGLYGEDDDPADRKTIWSGAKLKRIENDVDEDMWRGRDCLYDVVTRRPWVDLQSLLTRCHFYPSDIRDLLRHLKSLEELVCGVRFHDSLTLQPPQTAALASDLSGKVVNTKLRKLQICGVSGWITSQDPEYLNQLFIHGELVLPRLESFALSVECSVDPALDWILHGAPKPSIRDLQVVGNGRPAAMSKVRSAMRQLPSLRRFGYDGGSPSTAEVLLEILGNAKADGSPCSAGPPRSLREVHLFNIDCWKMGVDDMLSFMCRLCAYGEGDQGTHRQKSSFE